MKGTLLLGQLRAELERLAPPSPAEGGAAAGLLDVLGLVLADAPDFIVLMAGDGTILFANRVQPGRTLSDVVGHNVFEYYPPSIHAGMRAAFDRVLAGGKHESLDSDA